MSYELMDVEMADEIAKTIRFRQQKFMQESLTDSIKVVLFNYGESRRIAHCFKGCWDGPKSELDSRNGLPVCPRCGSPCTEDTLGWRLGLVKEQPGEDQWGITTA